MKITSLSYTDHKVKEISSSKSVYHRNNINSLICSKHTYVMSNDSKLSVYFISLSILVILSYIKQKQISWNNTVNMFFLIIVFDVMMSLTGVWHDGKWWCDVQDCKLETM